MDKKHEACKIIHTDLLPRARFARSAFAAMAEVERANGTGDGTSIFDGMVIAMDDIIASADSVMDLLEP